jgi:O-antigen ligase
MQKLFSESLVENQNLNDDLKLSFVVSVLYLGLFFTNYFYMMSNSISLPHNVISNIIKILIACVSLWGVKSVFKKSFGFMVLFSLFIIIIMINNSLFFQSNSEFFYKNIKESWVICFSMTLFILSIDDYSFLIKYFEKVAYVQLALCLFLLFKIFIQRDYSIDFVYSMGFSYACLFPALVFLNRAFFNFKMHYLLSTFLITLLIMVLGSRGALLCIAVYLAIMLVKQKSLKALFGVTFFLGSIYIFSKNILIFITKIIEKIGISSRSITMILNNEITTHLSGREYYYQTIIENIKANPLIFKGINASYVILDGSYPHNIFLELIFDLGLVIFVPVLFLLVFLSYKTIFSKKSPVNDIECILFSMAVPSLLVSGSLWVSWNFWMWLALALKQHICILNTSKSKIINKLFKS